MGIDQYISMTAEEREAAYRDLRASLEYDHTTLTGPRAEQATRHSIARTREAAAGESWPWPHARRADRMEQQLDEALDRYADRSVLKTALAVLTGRYDVSLRKGIDVLTIDGHVPPLIQAAQNVRQREIETATT